MKVKIDLDSSETLEQAEEKLYKALRGKKKAKEKLGERYADPMLNEFHDMILGKHLELMEEIKERIENEIEHAVTEQYIQPNR